MRLEPSLLWSLAALVAWPTLGVGVLLALKDARRWTQVALVFSAGSVAQSLAWALVEGSGVAAALAVNASIASVLLSAQPRRGLVLRDVVMPLVWVGASALVMVATDARLVSLGWLTPPLATWLSLGRFSEREARARRLVGAYLVGGSVPLVLAAGLFAWFASAAGSESPWLISSWSAAHLPRPVGVAVFALVALSVMTRLGVPPVHSWLPQLSESLPGGTMVALTSVQMAVHVMVRLLLAPLPDVVPSMSLLLMALGVVGTVYATVMAASQNRLRRVVAFVAVAQSSALLIGLAAGDLVSVSGALTNAISIAITSRGLMLAASTIEARVGPVDVRVMSGVAHPAPRLGAAALMLAFGAVGLPGSLGFVGEDLLLQDLVEQRPVVAAVLVICTAGVGIALLRAIIKTCFGPTPAWHRSVPDLFPHERALIALGVAVVFLGVWPAPLVKAHQADAAVLLSTRPR